MCRKTIQRTCVVTVASCRNICMLYVDTCSGTAWPAVSVTYVVVGTRLALLCPRLSFSFLAVQASTSFISQAINYCYISDVWYRLSGCQQSSAGPSQLLVRVSSTPCRKRWHQHHHWFSVICLKTWLIWILSFDPTSFREIDPTSFHKCLSSK